MKKMIKKVCSRRAWSLVMAVVITAMTFLSGNVGMQKVEAASDTQSVELVVGRRVPYNGYGTHQFKLSDGTEVYCVQPSKKYPPNGGYTATQINNDLLAKVLYFGYGGAGYQTDGGLYYRIDPSVHDDEDMLLYWTHVMAAYTYGSEDAFKSVDDDTRDGLKNIIEYWSSWCSVPSGFKVFVFNMGQPTQTMAYGYYEPTGTVQLKKTSANPALTNGNACYSLAGAVYGVYSDPGCTAQVGTLTTDANGNTNTVELAAGTYWVKEITAPKGYVLDATPHSVTVESGRNATVQVADEPGNDPVAITLQKVDRDTGETSQAGASLAGAQFTVKYYDGYYTKDTLPSNATRTWVLETKEVKNPISGEISYFTWLRDGYRISGDEFYRNSVGTVVVPLGTITIEETKAPDGYLLDGAYLQASGSTEKITGIYVAQIREDGGLVRPVGGNTFTISDFVTRGGVKIGKRDYDTEAAVAQGDATLAGAEIEILNANENPVLVDGVSYEPGDVVYRGVTGKDGTFTTAADLLPYGTYIYKEVKAPEGYTLDGTIEGEFSIEEDGVIVDCTTRDTAVKDRVIKQPFCIIKVAGNGGTDMPLLEGAGFSAYLESSLTKDKNGNYDLSKATPIVLTADGKTEMFTDSRGYVESIPIPYGTYIVRETTTPHNHVAVADFRVTIKEDSTEPQVWRVLNDEIFRAKIKIVKKDSETGRTVLRPNAEFKIYDLDNQKYVIQYTTYPVKVEHKSFKTDSSGTLMLPNVLPAGHYRIEEIAAPDGYLLNKEYVYVDIDVDTAYRVDPDTMEAVIEVGYSNKAVTGELVVEKHGEVLVGYKGDFLASSLDKQFVYEDKPLSGARFEVYAAEDIRTADNQEIAYAKGALVSTLVTGQDGRAVLSNLPLGKYRVVEVQAPNGYILKDSEKEQTAEIVYVDDKTPVVRRTLSFGDDRQKVSMSVIKKDAETNRPLAGAEFTLYAAEDIKDYKGKVIVKKDALLEKAVSDEHGNVAYTKDYPLAGYYVKETKAPEGYASYTDTIHFDTKYQGQDVVTAEYSSVVRNRPTVIEVTKTDITSGAELSGATMTVLDRAGNVVDTWTSKAGEVHVIKRLRVGETYTLREETAPYGYLIADEIRFTISDTGEVQQVTMRDLRPTGTIVINKDGELLEDAKKAKEHWYDFLFRKKNLSGVTFEIYAAEDIVSPDGLDTVLYAKNQLVGTLVTNKNGVAMKEGLPLGRYYLVETATIEGFVLDPTPIMADVLYAGQDTKVVYASADATNERQKVAITVIKKDAETGDPLEGAVIGLFAKEDILNQDEEVLVKADTEIGRVVTGKDGRATFDIDLPLGRYYLKELMAPAGYVKSDEPADLDATWQGQDVAVIEFEAVFENAPILVEFSKTDITGEIELSGAKLSIIDSTGNIVESWVSDGKPHMVDRLPAGDYILREETAPYGYVIANDVAFTVSETEEIQKVTMADDVTMGRIIIKKTVTGTDTPLAGAKFEIRDQDGKVLETLVTGKDGRAESSILPIHVFGKDGKPAGSIRYTVVEVEAPEGYEMGTDTEREAAFEWISSKDSVLEVTLAFENKPKAPKTGDDTDVTVWVLLAMAGAGVIALGVITRKRYSKKKES